MVKLDSGAALLRLLRVVEHLYSRTTGGPGAIRLFGRRARVTMVGMARCRV